ncbi:GatB/YqeY domain-containing protein [Clostridium formicaceticum]|uniref:Aspartyl-tRNA amidotransferase n=1 Tax=Clostridium formicaceticum TaxID=1497 RepID=A0AAC9WGS8_9CLOT|nr:GatB/YqeY domain-containing protein [Clostridium formicaceticum]AOY77561.1 aspartyl-tRNA amidotransferase [Clostridium formicaceticum]ARE88139.1 glutamyl-tRNA(Gln) amidotransferase subunit E [Clostridium formicaceticum]
MSLKERLTNDLKEAMKTKDQLRKNVITLIRSEIKQIEVDKRVELEEQDIIEIISRQLKQRKDAAEEFEKGGRQDLVEQTQGEIAVLLQYLPQQLSEEEVTSIVEETISEMGVNSMKEMGKVMAAVLPKVKGRADGKTVNQIVKQQLQ